jgi:hypothetical protein
MRGDAPPVRAHTSAALGFGLCSALVAAAALWMPASVHATSLRRMSLKELVQRSQKIVRGTVTQIDCQVDAQRRPWTLYTLEHASAAKGALTSRAVLRFRCLGGALDGRSYHVSGTPRVELGDDIIVFYAPDNAACQVMGWMQGHFRSLASPAGRALVFNYQDLPVVGVSTESVLLGTRPTWTPREDGSLRVMTRTAAAALDIRTPEGGATPEDFMFDLGMLARFHPNSAPSDRASEGTEGVVGRLPELRAINPLAGLGR